MFLFSHGSQISTDTMRGAFIKKHETRRSPTDRRGGNITDAHGWVFSRIVYSCSAAYRLVLMRRRRNGSARIFSHAEGALRCEKSVEICGICGRQLSAQCAKEQAECFYSPTDRALSTDTMRNAFIKKNTRPRGQRRRRCAKTIGLGLAPSAVGEAHRG